MMGIDAYFWFLFKFLNETKGLKDKYWLLSSHDQVKQLLHNLENEGVFTRAVGESNETLFYSVTDLYDENRTVWRFYWPDDDFS